MKIQVLCDNPLSWVIPYATKLVERLRKIGHDVELINDVDGVSEGDILVMLSCEKLFRKLHLNKHNLVVHGSALPQGKGWSPMTWHILEGRGELVVTLFEAVEKVDAGNIYGQAVVKLDGTELVDELRSKQFEITEKVIVDFVENYPVVGVPQSGNETFYSRRTAKDSRLDTDKSIAEQFNLLRVSDNERYPAWFEMNGVKYTIKIYKA